MLKNLLFLIVLLFSACTAADLPDEYSVPLSVDTNSLTFDAEGGEQSFTVTASDQIYIVRGEAWITCRKGTRSESYQTVVTISVEKNTGEYARKSNVSVVAGEKTHYVEISQAGQSGDDPGNVPENEPTMMVALSFDDGPNDHTTAQVLDILEEYGVPASFFVIGQNINDQTAVQMVRAISLGCEIQNHSFSHSYMSKLTDEQFIDEIQRTDDLVEKYTSTRPTLFRPPYIDHNAAMHNAIDHTFISGVDCRDWEAGQSATARYNDLMKKVKDGDIILLHDFYGNDNTVEALRMIIPELKERGYKMVTVSELFRLKGIAPTAHSGYIYTNVMQGV